MIRGNEPPYSQTSAASAHGAMAQDSEIAIYSWSTTSAFRNTQKHT